MSEMTVQQAMQLAMDAHRAGRLAEAEGMYRQILEAAPDYPDALHLLGLLALQCNQPAGAIELLERAIVVNPSSPAFADTLGQALVAAGRIDEGIERYRLALGLRPNFAEAYTNLGAALMKNDRLDEAIDVLQKALAIRPDLAAAHNNLGSCYSQLARPDDAIPAFRQALALAGNEPTIHYNLATSLLTTGDFAQGFREYEWRWRVPGLNLTPLPLNKPLWDGSDLGGKRILLHSEQGYGDTIQFIRYAPLVARRGGKVLVYCPPPLHRLIQTVEGVHTVLPTDSLPADYDLHAPIHHLPLVFGTTLDSIPQNAPYLHPDPVRVENFKSRLIPDSRINVGIVWAGRPEHTNDRHRSIALHQLAPLSNIAGARFYSLQIGPAAAQLNSAPPGMQIIDWTLDLTDFAETAALMSALDLIISVDTAPAHLTGALGKPLFLLLPFAPDWRWMLHRPDCPWYPTARLFRQPTRGDWATPIAMLADAVSRWTRP